MDKRCSNYGSSWCADFECKDCPILDTDEQPELKEKETLPINLGILS